MTYPTFTYCPSFYSYVDELPVSIRKDAGPYEESRTKLADVSRRIYTLPFRVDNTERQQIVGFFDALPGRYSPFYFDDPKDTVTATTRLVRLAEDFTWVQEYQNAWTTTITLIEVPS